LIKKIYKLLEINNDKVILDGKKYSAIKGKHAIYIPEINTKFILSFNGKIESYVWKRGKNKTEIENFTFNDNIKGFNEESLLSILNEYQMFEMLSKSKKTPIISGLVYVETVISDFFPGTLHADPIGMYGYIIQNANKLVPGHWNYNSFLNEFIDNNKIKASPGALGDLKKGDNTINGYLVDLRRTFWDCMNVVELIYNTDDIKINLDKEELKNKISNLAQFPHKERKQNYQTYYLDGKYIDGTRKTLYRFDKMNIEENMTGKSVLDLGCQLGSMVTETYLRGARKVTGLEYQPEYVECARDLARFNGMQINYMIKDLTNTKDCISYINSYYSEPIDVVFALSIWKHVKTSMFDVLNGIKWKTCYIESHNTGMSGLETQHVKEMLSHMNNWKCEYIGQTEDRSPRCVWKCKKS
jgi:2-polyprenyl-3-methyl-5-hydroxy-6-metoxy-1,4-benzoquinol methylase